MKLGDAARGSTVILIIWVLGILSMIATFLIYRSEVEWAATISFERSMAARRLAGEVLRDRLDLLVADHNDYDTMGDDWYGAGGISQLERDGYQITVMVEDEGSKPNLNCLTAEELAIVFKEKSVYEPLLDWIDSDNELHNEGAEQDYYQALHPSRRPRNGFISSPKELYAVKNGSVLYTMLAPHCTVYGKFNPNALTSTQFENLLLSADFDQSAAERIAADFAIYRIQGRLETFNQFLKFSSVSFQTLDKLKPLLEFTGQCNINFVDEIGLKMLLKKAGYSPDISGELIRLRTEEPFNSLEKLQAYLYLKNKKIKSEDYFKVSSSIFRFQIWLSKGKRRFYLESIQARRSRDNSPTGWEITPLTWHFDANDDAPDLPVRDSDVKEAKHE